MNHIFNLLNEALKQQETVGDTAGKGAVIGGIAGAGLGAGLAFRVKSHANHILNNTAKYSPKVIDSANHLSKLSTGHVAGRLAIPGAIALGSAGLVAGGLYRAIKNRKHRGE